MPKSANFGFHAVTLIAYPHIAKERFAVKVAGIMTTTLIMDRQWEFRDNRSKSLTNREFEQEEERKAMEAAFKRADDHFENVPVPGRRD